MLQQDTLNAASTNPTQESFQTGSSAGDSSHLRMYTLLDELEKEVHHSQHPRSSRVVDLIQFLRKQICSLQAQHYPFPADHEVSNITDPQGSRYWDYP